MNKYGIQGTLEHVIFIISPHHTASLKQRVSSYFFNFSTKQAFSSLMLIIRLKPPFVQIVRGNRRHPSVSRISLGCGVSVQEREKTAVTRDTKYKRSNASIIDTT